MWLLDVEAILDRENDIRGFDAEIEVLKRHNDKSTSYAILSHRWGTEVTYDEITGLTAMKPRKRDNVRERDGYQMIIKSCEQAKQDGYKRMWIDTCCIDKRSSAELSEAINSMYRWYRNAQKCYVYLNDVVESIFPAEQDFSRFGKSNGWPEWFSRGWTLQELIAPTEVEFFNNSWVSIGTKRDLTSSLEVITRIPEMVLKYEQVLRSTSRCPSVAHIMSWAAHRKTSRMEDRAYSLMGLFGVNMPMLYGEGSKAFQRLQREIIRTSSDYSIFAWNLKGQFLEHGSVLADDPSCFRGCTDVEKVAPSGFIKELEQYMRQDGLFLSKDASKLGSSQSNVDSPQLSRWDVTNVGIQVWLPIIPHRGSSYLKAVLPCQDRYGNLITIDFEFRGLNFVRSLHAVAIRNMWPQFKLLYLDCSQDAEESHRLRLHDGLASYGFTRCGTFPCEVVGNTVTLSTHGNNLVVLLYANDDARSRFAIGLGYHLGRVWARIVCDEYPAKQEVWSPWEDFAQQAYDILWDAPIEKSWHSNFHSTPVVIKDTHLPRSIWHARVVYDDSGSGYTNVMVDIQQCSGCCAAPRECTYRSRRDKLWLPWTSQTVASHELELDGRPAWLDECSGQEIALGDYGGYRPNGKFKRHGNIFEDMRELGIDPTDSVYRPVVSRVSSCRHMLHRIQTQHEIVTTSGFWIPLELHQPKRLSFPSNKESELLLKALSTRFSGKRLVKTVIECSQVHTVDREGRRKALGGDGNRSAAPGILTPLCIIATPLAWNKGPPSTQRRERFQNIREHFYASANLRDLAGIEARQKSTINGVVDFSAMFGLEYLENYVGEITFFERLRSIMEFSLVIKRSAGNGLLVHTPNPSFNSHRQLLIPLLLEKHEGRSKPWLDGKRKAQREAELLSQTLGIGLLEHIRNTLLDASEGKQRASQVGRTDYDMGDVYSTVQGVQALQAKLQATEDEDEQRALEEDITGKILQFYLCGIYTEVDQLLPKVVDHIRNGLDSKMIPKDRIRSALREITDMIKGTRRMDMDHDTAHLWRIMLDSGAGVSKHQLWLSARDAEQAMRLRCSGGSSVLSTQATAPSMSAGVSSTSTV